MSRKARPTGDESGRKLIGLLLTRKKKWRKLRKLKKRLFPGVWASPRDSRRQRRHARKEQNKDAAADAIEQIASRTGTVGLVNVPPFPDVGGYEGEVITPRFGVASASSGGDATNRWL